MIFNECNSVLSCTTIPCVVPELLWSCFTTSLGFVIGLKELMPLNLYQSDQTQINLNLMTLEFPFLPSFLSNYVSNSLVFAFFRVLIAHFGAALSLPYQRKARCTAISSPSLYKGLPWSWETARGHNHLLQGNKGYFLDQFEVYFYFERKPLQKHYGSNEIY